jgi:hypothetical protein
MSDNNEIKNSIHPWIVSLGISVFCCALFFAFMSSYVGSINQSLTQIDERLANIEARGMSPINAYEQPVAQQPVPQSTVEQPTQAPTIETPSVNAPTSPSYGSGAVPTPSVPEPESATPELPSVPSGAAPIPAPMGTDAPTKQ